VTRAELDAALAAETPADWLAAADAAFAERRKALIQSLRKRDFRTGRPLIGAFGSAGPTESAQRRSLRRLPRRDRPLRRPVR
jgi:hypothetical protein